MKHSSKVLLTCGLCLTVLGCAIGAVTWHFGAEGYQGRLLQVDSHGVRLGADPSAVMTQKVGSRTYESLEYDLSQLGEFDRIVLDIGLGDVNVSTGETAAVRSENYPEGVFVCQVEGGVLYVEEHENQNFTFASHLPRSAEIVLPEGLRLSRAELKLGLGDTVVTGLQAEKTDIDCGMGDLQLEELDTGSLTVEAGVGSVSLSGRVGGSARLESGVGDLTFSGTLLGDFSVNAGTGSVTLQLEGHPGDYRLSLSQGVGSITVDGREIHSDSWGSEDAPIAGALSAGVGDMTVSFYE